MPLRIEPLQREHLADAAALVAHRYAALRATVPDLPPCWEDPAVILPMLTGIAPHSPGAVALLDGQLVGFMQGIAVDDFRGARAAFCPEWANAAVAGPSRRIYDALYTHLSAQWVADRRLTHLVCQFPHDRAAIEGWHWLGFGMLAGDAVRPLTDVMGPTANEIAVRRATVDDLDDFMGLELGLCRHLNAPPTFLYGPPGPRDEMAAWLAEPGNALWIAYRGDKAVSFIRIGPASHDCCLIIQDEGTASITGAFTVEEARGQGIGAAVLARAIRWARDAGYVRCAVDFEPMNTLAARFWTRHFTLVSCCMVRQIDPRFQPQP